MRSTFRYLTLLTIALAAAGCDGESTTAPSSTEATTTDTTTSSEPAITESWTGVVAVGGETFYSFSIAKSGTVLVTLESVSGPFVPSTVTMGLAIGTPDDTSCAGGAVTGARAGSSPQLTETHEPGLYCASVSDVGNLFAPATVTVSIAHP